MTVTANGSALAPGTYHGKVTITATSQFPSGSPIDVAVTLTEPPNGIVANLLNIEGKPDIALSVTGKGPVDNLVTTMALDAGGTRALEGAAQTREAIAAYRRTYELTPDYPTIVQKLQSLGAAAGPSA